MCVKEKEQPKTKGIYVEYEGHLGTKLKKAGLLSHQGCTSKCTIYQLRV